MLPVVIDSDLNTPDLSPAYERFIPFPYGSKEWKALYNKRVSVERVFSRLKTYRKLDALRTRGLAKVWLHMALSIVSMNVSALVNATRDVADLRRSVAA